MGEAVPIPLKCSAMMPCDDARHAVRVSIEDGSRVAAVESTRSAGVFELCLSAASFRSVLSSAPHELNVASQDARRDVLAAVNDTLGPSPHWSGGVARSETLGRGVREQSLAIAAERVAARAHEGSRRRVAPYEPWLGRRALSVPRQVAEAQRRDFGCVAKPSGWRIPVQRSDRPRIMQVCLASSASPQSASRCGSPGQFPGGRGLEALALGGPAGWVVGCHADLSDSRSMDSGRQRLEHH